MIDEKGKINNERHIEGSVIIKQIFIYVKEVREVQFHILPLELKFDITSKAPQAVALSASRLQRSKGAV